MNDFCGLLVTLLTNRDSTWYDNIRKHLPWLNVTSDWEVFKKLPFPKLLLIHFDMMPSLIRKLVKYRKFNWCCIDEAQRIASRSNGASKMAARLSWIRRKMVLTGTPQEGKGGGKKAIGHGGETDYFGIFRFLNPEVFGTNWSKFENRYMEWPSIDFEHAPKGSALWQKKILQQRILKNKAHFREDRRKEFIELLKPHCIRLDKSDVGIKEARVHKISIPMSRDQERCYKEMVDQGFTYLPKRSQKSRARRVIAQLAITNIAKQRQIATGFAYDEEDRLHHISDTKLQETMKLVGRLSKPIVIFTAFRPDNDKVSEALIEEGYDVIQVNGSTKKKLRPQIWRDFQRGRYDVAVVQTKTGGTGVDLWKANNAIVYSMSHSYRDWDQAKARLDHRSKQRPSEFFVLCSKNTIDDELYDLVVVKKLNTELTLKHLKKGSSTWPRTPNQPRKKSRKPNPTNRSSALKRLPKQRDFSRHRSA